MNERIKELADQAGATVLTTHGMEDVVDGCYVIGPARLEKFAELIVRECAAVQHKRFCEHGDVSWDILMEHFGVRE